MRATKTVQNILRNYEGENPGVKANLCRMLMEGKLGGTGKMMKAKLREVLKDYKLPGL